ncbi:MAG TPA: 50S ribosomal protein L21 [bacterium]|nr:50S ribosomal protein L21 [bacterium]
MIAVIEVGGNQFIVRAGDVIEVDRQSAEAGTEASFSPLLVSDADGNSVEVGMPVLDSKSVKCRVVEHFRDEKVKVFKMKSKKHYHRTRGFRADRTRLEILSIA